MSYSRSAASWPAAREPTALTAMLVGWHSSTHSASLALHAPPKHGTQHHVSSTRPGARYTTLRLLRLLFGRRRRFHQRVGAEGCEAGDDGGGADQHAECDDREAAPALRGRARVKRGYDRYVQQVFSMGKSHRVIVFGDKVRVLCTGKSLARSAVSSDSAHATSALARPLFPKCIQASFSQAESLSAS